MQNSISVKNSILNIVSSVEFIPPLNFVPINSHFSSKLCFNMEGFIVVLPGLKHDAHALLFKVHDFFVKMQVALYMTLLHVM